MLNVVVVVVVSVQLGLKETTPFEWQRSAGYGA